MVGGKAAAEPTYILVDHSESMAFETRQQEAQSDIDYFLRNYGASDDVSISYFGSENGGDCDSPVAINEPRPLGETEKLSPNFSAAGDNPLLGAIDSVFSSLQDQPAKIIVISDFDAVCGSVLGACMAVRGYENQFPKATFQFEPIDNGNASSALYACLIARPKTNDQVAASRFGMNFQFNSMSSKAARGSFGSTHSVASNIGWATYLVFVFLILATATLAVTRFQFTTEEYGQFLSVGTQGGDTTQHTAVSDSERRQNLVKAASGWMFIATLIVGLVFLLLWFCPYADMGRISWAIYDWMNLRFGSAFVSTVLGGFLAWSGFSIWKGGITRLSSDWKKNFDAFQDEANSASLRSIISDSEATLEDEAARASTEFDKYRPFLGDTLISTGDGRLRDYEEALHKLLALLKESLTSTNWKKWSDRRSRQPKRICDQLHKSYALNDDTASELQRVFELWNEFEKRLPIEQRKKDKSDNELS